MKRSRTIVTVAATLALALALPAGAQVRDWRKIKYPSLPAFGIEKPQAFTLENGMKVFLMEDHELPMIEAFARVRTGAAWEPAPKTGLAAIFGQVLREGGTASMSGDEMDEYLAQRAAMVETGVADDFGYASASSLAENFDETLAGLADILRHPVFDEDKLALAKKQTSASIARRNDDISGITGREFARLIYGQDSPLGRLTEYATVAAISRQDLVDWHNKYYHPNQMMLGLVGDFNSAQMKGKIQETFGDWKRGSEQKLGDVAYNQRVKPGVYFIEKDDVTQAYVRLGHLGMRTSADPEYYAAQVMNEVLGGSFASRLFSNVRSKKGLAYSVFGGIGSDYMHEGVFQVGLSTKSGTMSGAVQALKDEIRGIIANPPTEEEMRRAKESILNSFVFRYDSKGEILGQLMTYDYYGLPADFLDTYQKRIEAVTAEDVARVAKKYVHPDEVALLVVGNSEEFDVPVSTLGDVHVIDITILPPPDDTPAVSRTPESLEAGKKLFSTVVASVYNGAAEKVRSLKGDYSVALTMNGQTMNADQEMSLLLPDKFRRTLKLPMGEQTIVINGKQGYMAMGGNKQALPAEQVEEIHQGMARDLLYLVVHHDDPQLQAVAAGQDQVDGQACRLVAVTYEGAESRLCVDDKGRVLTQSYQGKHPLQQTPGRLEVRFSEYANLDGRMLPKQHVVSFDGEKVYTLKVNSLDINPELDPLQFAVN